MQCVSVTISTISTKMEADLSNFTIPLDTPISKLDAGKSFEGLDNQERLYCHFLSRASWEGCYICLFQTSPESVPVFLFLRELFTRQSLSSLRKSCEVTISDDEFKVYNYRVLSIPVCMYVCMYVCVCMCVCVCVGFPFVRVCGI